VSRVSAFDAIGKMQAVAGWIRANSLACLVAVLVSGAVVGAGALALSIADREDGMRETQTEIIELSNLATGIREQTPAAFQGTASTGPDFVLRRQIVEAALPTARQIEFDWDDPIVTGIVAQTQALARRRASPTPTP
jgi:hypothetical protein